ncbi:MAG: amidophosphoribosyltransferase [Candidatus Nitrosocaldaceae archaeon]|nr:MAG: amidophosphoribosyltransferase [Candidatus Nitrosocaldaceae archaeon]
MVTESSYKFKEIEEKYSSNAAIGHVRYSTIGKSNLDNAQPLKVKDLCIAHNGTIANVEELANMVGGCSFTPQSMNDTLLAAKRIVSLLNKDEDMNKALSVLKNDMIGSFCFTFVTDHGKIFAARDPKGFRPLVLGYHKETETYVIASESCAFLAVGAELIRDVEPGELIKVSDDGIEYQQFANEKPHSHCAFEYTYFAHPTSIMEGVNIYIARKNIGRELAKKFPLSADVVIPVPDSARPVALGYAQELGIEFEEGLLKDRYSKKGKLRSFIEPYQKDREEITKWIIPIREVIKDKEVIVVDDSIVRGTSSIAIVNAIRQAKAKKINMIVAYPSIKFPCYAGIDFPSSEELIAYTVSKDSNDDINKLVAKAINADFVGYNDPDTLAKAIGLPREELCFTCSTGDYSNLGLIEKPIFRSRKEVKGE